MKDFLTKFVVNVKQRFHNLNISIIRVSRLFLWTEQRKPSFSEIKYNSMKQSTLHLEYLESTLGPQDNYYLTIYV